jgi:hypothetical protein
MKTLTVLEGLVMPHFAQRPGMIALGRNRRRVSARIGRPTGRTVQRRVARAALAAAPPAS